MSTRFFCDSCGEELTPDRRISRDGAGRLFGRVAIPGNRMMFVEVLTGMDDTWNAGHYCNVCIATCLREALGSKDAKVLEPNRGGNPQEA